RFDNGANVWARSPTPSGSGNTNGKTTSRTYDDSIGRVVKEKIENTGAYTRYSYSNTGTALSSYTTIVDANNDSSINSSDEVPTETLFDGAGRVRMSRTENPNSTGGYTGKLVEYDILGRAKRESVPTEIDSSWNPAGDDYRGGAGWLWNTKEFDWKGRVTRTIPSDSNGSDGKDTLVEYAGCGCAGGQVTTVKGPVTSAIDAAGNPQTTKRRWQKAYEDVLGRTFKTEVWDLDGGSVYSTTKSTFNGRDQATLIRQYAGSDSSTTYQETTLSYDGHGRVYRKHLPIESGSTAYTQYSYNTDDTIATETDARGAIKSFQYGHADNSGSIEYRNVLTNIAYSVPTGSGIEVPASVAFAYDSSGNRTQMAEGTGGTGTTTYTYDELSRLKSETKTFPTSFNLTASPGGGSGAYTIGYNYFLTGGVKNVTDPFGQEIDYTVDKIGRMKTVTGSAWNAYGSSGVFVTEYVDDANYRAWGAQKHVEYSNGLTMTETFDDALRPISHVVANSTTNIFDKTYEYLSDGKMAHSTEGSVNRVHVDDWERSFEYDFAGRLKKARTGEAARGKEPGTEDKVPYDLDYSYDSFNNNTQRSGQVWFGSKVEDYENLTWTAATNKVSGWDYDAAGSVLYSDDYKEESTTQTYTYNAAGSLMSTSQDAHHSSTRKTDGEQRLVFLSQAAGEGNTVMGYYIYSSVLGKVLTETSLNGAKEKTYVHDLSGSVIAVQQITRYSSTFSAPEVRWEHTDAGGQSYFPSMYNGNWTWEESAELDPLQRAVKVNYGSSFEAEPGYIPLGYPYFGDDKSCQSKAAVTLDCNLSGAMADDDEPPNTEDCDGEWKKIGGKWVCKRGTVNKEDEYEPPLTVPDFYDASTGSDEIKMRLDNEAFEKLIADAGLIFMYNPACLDFIKNVSAALEANNVRQRTSNLLEVLRKVHAKGGMWYTKNAIQNQATGGSLDSDTTSIELDAPLKAGDSVFFSAQAKKRFERDQELKVARTAVGEAFHKAGDGNEDMEMYRAYARWKQLPLPDFPTTPPDGRDSMALRKYVTFWSGMWHPRMNDACSYNSVPHPQ
ncbi:MAG: hypothetical protein DMF63_13750, partial [Acidobacteria bacterium]